MSEMDVGDEMGTSEVTADPLDVLDTTKWTPSPRQLISCVICDQKFTNKLKVVMHWCINHEYKLCCLCSNYAFKYDSDRIQHEQLHLPIGCSSCDVEFSKYCHDSISEHYKKAHQSFLCKFCSGVIQPVSKYPEHVEKKHNTLSFTSLISNGDRIFELVGEENERYFNCFMCDKRKHTSLLLGHYIFYHNLSIHAIKKHYDMTPELKVNGSILNEAPEIEDSLNAEECKEKCNVCENLLEDEDFLKAKELHGIFCQGYVVCTQSDCNRMFKNGNALNQHLDNEHQSTCCKFGCNLDLPPQEINEHLQSLHDIIECFLCNLINSSGQFKNHLRDNHSVNLMTYEKAMKKAKSKLFHVEKGNQVMCNFCDQNLTDEIKEFSFVNHYKERHEITMTAILRNLDKNPIIDVILSDKQMRDESMLKHFAIVKQFDKLVETDFDASQVYCIGVEHVEPKPLLMIDDSQHICEFCNKPFEVACRLYEHLTAMHGFKLLNLNDCDECHSKWQVGKEIEEDNKDFNLSLVCPFDESNHVRKIDFKDHLKAEHLDESLTHDKIIYKCLVCSFTYKNIEEIRDHFNQNHPDVKRKYCKLCRYKLTNNDSEHFTKNHAKALKKSEKLCCKICSKEFSKPTTAKIHFEKTHHQQDQAAKKRLSSFQCQFSLCNLRFENKEVRRMHMLFAHPNEKIFGCKTCDLKFTTKSSLSSHTVVHKNVTYTCEFCQKSFTRRDSYKEHLLIHSDVRLKCSFCEKVFVQRSNLVRHERIHLQEKPYKCTYCEKTFSDKGACTSHEKVHTREEASNCEVCGKHFARKQKLKYHMRLHTLENVLTCECGKIFPESYSFRKHRETHERGARFDKPQLFQCNFCDKRFKTKKTLEKHEEKHNEEESIIRTRITCTLCNSTDFTSETIKSHLMDVHHVDASNWENYINEVEFEMDIEPEEIMP